MSLKLYLFRYLILKQVNGLRTIQFKDLDMAHGFMKKTFLSTEDLNFQVLLYQPILFLKLICLSSLKITLTYKIKLLI